YGDLFPYSLEWGSYENDLYIQQSFVFNSSIYYRIIEATGLNLFDDHYAYPYQLAFGILSAVFVAKILIEFLNIKNLDQICVMILLTLVLPNMILYGTIGGIWSGAHIMTHSAHSLMFPLIYFALKKRLFFASLTSAIMLSFAVKASWAAIGVVILFLFCNRPQKIWHLGWLLLPVVTAVLMAANADISLDKTVRLKLSEIVLLRDELEDAVDQQPFLRLFLFAISMPIFVYFVRRLDSDQLKRFCWIAMAVVFGIAVLGGLYTAIGYKFYPNPALILLSPTRSTKLYHFLFFMLYFNYFLTSTELSWHERISFTLAAFVMQDSSMAHGGVSLGRVSVASILIIGGVVVPRFIAWAMKLDLKETWPFRLVSGRRAIFAPLLLIATAIFALNTYTVLQFRLPRINTEAYSAIGKWLFPWPPEATAEALMRLRQCKDDFILLSVMETQAPEKARFTYTRLPSVITNKSKFIGDFAHFYFNVPAYEEHLRRQTLSRELIRGINIAKIPINVTDALSDIGVVVIFPSAAKPVFQAHLPIRNITNQIDLVIYDDHGTIGPRLDRCGLPVSTVG
ncbi:MAG: hypothetical protein CFH10_01290, partial [Alphaproteobacteria bacterium MarineAlpha4_Bin2]